MSNRTIAASPKLVEKTLNIQDESDNSAFEEFEFTTVYGKRAKVEIPRDDAHYVEKKALRLANADLPVKKDAAKLIVEPAINAKPKGFATKPAHVG
jgi:hypothetical protein